MKAMINSPLHPLLGDSFAVVTGDRRKSGRSSPRRSMSLVMEWFTVVSMRDRTWWRNLRGDKRHSCGLVEKHSR